MTSSVTRLHISPLNPETLPTVLGSEIHKFATNISFHTLQTFPESSYGYVELPVMQAEKVKKKLNGAILKGKKVRVEEARPKKRKHSDQSTEQSGTIEDNVPEIARKKPKKDTNVITGHELPLDRKVKRGWTEPRSSKLAKKMKKDKHNLPAKPQSQSKYTEHEELLFKTKVPKNRSSGQDKGHKSKTKIGKGTDLIHEFEKSTKVPSFLRSEKTSTKSGLTYKDGHGWMDEEGMVVEEESGRISQKRKAAQRGIHDEVIERQKSKVIRPANHKAEFVADGSNDDTTSSSASAADTDSVSSEAADSDAEDSVASEQDTESTSSSGSSTSDAASVASSESASHVISPGDAPNPESTPSKSTVHPLEALFKKPVKPASLQTTLASSQDNVKPSLEIQTSFSFFDQHNDQDNHPPMPMTPFSSQDLRSRESRSAAPTPDTAHPSRMSSIFNGEDSDGELSEMEDSNLANEPVSKDSPSSNKQGASVPQTDFEKEFWEKRGENNRAWKARRRTVLKEKRQRDNRARRPKNW